MSEVSFSSKREPAIIGENSNWVQPYCRRCPYFIHVDALNQDGRIAVRCVRPVGEGCLAESILVAGAIMADAHNEMVKKMYADRDKRDEKEKEMQDMAVVNVLTKKRQGKMLKRRR